MAVSPFLLHGSFILLPVSFLFSLLCIILALISASSLSGSSSLSGEPVVEGWAGWRSAAASGHGAGGGHPRGAEQTPAVHVLHTQVWPGWAASGEDRKHANPHMSAEESVGIYQPAESLSNNKQPALQDELTGRVSASLCQHRNLNHGVCVYIHQINMLKVCLQLEVWRTLLKLL